MNKIIPEFNPQQIATRERLTRVYSGCEVEIARDSTNIDILIDICWLVDGEVSTKNELTFEREHDGAPYEFAADFHIPEMLVEDAYEIAQDQVDSGVTLNSFKGIRKKYDL